MADTTRADAVRAQLNDGIALVPCHLWRGLSDHVMHGTPTGDFLTALLANRFTDAVLRADPESAAHLRPLAHFLHNHVPVFAWGSAELVAAWRRAGGATGSGGRPSPAPFTIPASADATAGAFQPETSDD